MTENLPVLVLVSGGGSNLQALIDVCKEDFPARIIAVISNKADAGGLKLAATANIPTTVVDHKTFTDRQQFDSQLMTAIDHFQPALVILAGFMRILTEDFVQHYQGRLLNIHPSLLPLYPGLNTHQRALDNADTIHGASVHFVSDELDGGPVILQASVPVLANDTRETLAARVLKKEHLIYPRVLYLIATQRLKLEGTQILLDGKTLRSPLKLEELQSA